MVPGTIRRCWVVVFFRAMVVGDTGWLHSEAAKLKLFDSEARYPRANVSDRHPCSPGIDTDRKQAERVFAAGG